MTVRAKFVVHEKNQSSVGYSIKLWPVSGGSPENDRFYEASPGGMIELATVNAAAAE